MYFLSANDITPFNIVVSLPCTADILFSNEGLKFRNLLNHEGTKALSFTKLCATWCSLCLCGSIAEQHYLQLEVSLYVKGFGAAAVQDMAAKKNFAKNKNYETANFSYYRNLEQR